MGSIEQSFYAVLHSYWGSKPLATGLDGPMVDYAVYFVCSSWSFQRFLLFMFSLKSVSVPNEFMKAKLE